eukprot:67774_1
MRIHIFLLLISNVVSQEQRCVFHDVLGSGYSIDLRGIANKTVSGYDPHPFYYTFTPCGNHLKCDRNGTDYAAMMLQINENDIVNSTGKPFCAVVADWDKGSTQPEYDDDRESWNWHYFNGWSDENCWKSYNGTNYTYNRTLNLEIFCGRHLRSDEFLLNSVDEIGPCYYRLEIFTGAACVGGATASNNLSGGSVVIIIFICVIFVYCFGGCAFTNCKKFPHQEFWETFPKYVFAGCQTTKSVVGGTCGCC